MIDLKEIIKECNYKTSRSSGAGGQHVNKVETKVELIFNIKNSLVLSEKEKDLLLKNLKSKLDVNSAIHVTAQNSRSQHRNRLAAEKKLIALLKKNSKPPKKRKLTKPSKGSVEERIKRKKIIAEKKKNRQKTKW